ncbi:hypothetical protein QJQ45_000455 [Haematococcus lacustris]|nr:hypothetical protein QJQ45_000455 [Haematococcus lacustris]
MLRHYISPAQSDWPFFLSLAEFAVNNSWQESIQSTPFLVNTGQSPLTPALLELPGEVYCPSARKLSEWWQSNVKQARHFMEQAQQRQAYLANKGRRDVEFSPGQLVLLSTKNLRLKPGKAKKLLPRFIGPFKVLEHVGPVAVRLDLPPAMARMHPVFHVALLRPYTTRYTSKCRARHIFIDTNVLYGLMSDAGMLGVLTEAGVTSLDKFRNGALPDPARPGHYIEGPANSKVASRWDALLPDPLRQKLASPEHRFDQVVHTDGVAISVMFLRPKPAAPPAKLPRMAKGMGAVNPLAHLHAEWLSVDPGKTNMATVAHEERSADGSVVSVRHWTLTAGQYYRDSGITRQTQATKIWLATVKTQLTALSHVSSKPSSLASYRRFADTVLETYDAMWAEVSKKRWANAKFRLYCGKQRVVASFWAKVNKQAKKLWPDRILALAYGAAGFKGSGTIGCRGVPVSQMQKEAMKQFRPERVVLVDEFRTSRVSSADNTPSETLLDTPPESFRWLRPVKSMAKRSQVRGLMCSTSINNITRFYDRDVSAALNIRRCAVGPGPRPTELCYWTNRPAMPKPGQPGQEWVEIADKPLLRKWQRQQQQ